MLYCLVLGDSIRNTILVDVSRDLSVSDLRDVVKEKKKPYFDDIPADRLKLWKVNISTKDKNLSTKIHAEDEEIKEQLVDENELDPLQDVKDYFDDEEALSDKKPIAINRVIRIVIQPDYVTGQKRHAYPETIESEPKRQKILPETFNLDDFVSKLSTEISIVSPPELYPIDKQGIAGRFCKPGSFIPISGKSFPDLRLNDEKITPAGKHLASLFEKDEKAFHLLYAVSGAGKTRAIFDMAMHNKIFVTYIECMPAADESQGCVKMEPTADTNFGDLVERIKEINVKTEGEHDDIENVMKLFRVKAKHLIAQDFTARLLYLVILKKSLEGLTPREYLLSQIDGGREIIKLIKPYLESFETFQLENIFMYALMYLKTTLQTSLVFALDEANVATKLFSSSFRNRNKHPRGLLTPMVEFLYRQPVSIVIAGTSFSLEQGRSIQSDIGKGIADDYIADFQTLTIEEVKSYLEYYLDFSDCSFKDIEERKYLAGRPRLTARLILEIIREENSSKGEKSKQDVFKAAVEQTLKAVRKRLTETLNNFVKEAYDGIDNFGWKTMLETLFVNCWFFGGYVSRNELDDRSRKLIDCGIASLKPGCNKYPEVTEPLAVQVVNIVLASKYNRPTEALIMNLFLELKRKIADSNFDKSDTAKGLAWQYLVLARLIDFKGETVHDFVNKFYNTQLPDWTKDAIINIESYGNKTILSMLDNALKDAKDDVDVVEELLWGSAKNKLLVPSPAMRPDGLFIGKCDSWNRNTYWTFLTSAKFRTENLSSNDFETDFRSTDWKLVYCQVNGKKVNCPNLKKRLNIVCEEFVHCGSIRVHFIYPGVSSGRGGCYVQGNDVIMYIDKTLLGRYFEKTYADLLEKILSKS